MSNKKGILALSPLIVFVVLYLVTSVIARDFYKVPITVAFLISSIYAVIISGKGTLNDRVNAFCKGAGTPNIMLMLIIFILAGAFASTAKGMGSIDATVTLTLSILPKSMILAGLFVAACFISLSIGTSVGTIVALVPIAAGLASQTGSSVAFLTAVVVGGAFFGDNLSFISDTTIMATKTQGCKMSDKFRANIYIVLPAAIAVLIIYIIMGQSTGAPNNMHAISAWKVLPYLTVLATAVAGMNVMAVLTLGIVICALIGLLDGSYDIYSLMGAMGEGILGMSELIIVTMLAAGLLEMISKAGGIQYIIEKMTRHIHGKRGAELSMGALVALVGMCTANNTIAILTVGDISRQIAEKYGIDPRKAASILDTYSCFMQGLIPYGAQMLIAAGLAELNPISILPYLYYPVTMGLFATLSIIFRIPRKYS
ncbi:MAG: Na+/H+ antiporter NhaC family protein [Prevotellaceae bacterium]|nr:Na+/H+ antiporter NhaC family protein [Prevotellaceae bacterium]